MNSPPLLLLFHPRRAPDSGGQADLRAVLSQLGEFTVHPCQTRRQVEGMVAGTGSKSPAIAILNGLFLENCSLALHLSRLIPSMGILATGASGEHQVVSLLESGADNALPLSATPAIILQVLQRLLRRLGHGAPIGVAQTAVFGEWLLQDQAWVLRSPSGLKVGLTTSERAFMLALFAAPALRASHEELLRAVGAYGRRRPEGVRQPGLGVLVSRMREKFRVQGQPLPLKSLHGWGYMFTARVRVID